MAASSERKIEANRRNAARSTGPKSAEGKEKSRRNGWKHGLAAVVVVPEEETAALEAAVAGWSEQIGPVGLVEESLVHQMAAADVRMRRCAGQRDGDGRGRRRGGPPLGDEAKASGPTPGAGPEGRPGQRGRRSGGVELRLRLAAPPLAVSRRPAAARDLLEPGEPGGGAAAARLCPDDRADGRRRPGGDPLLDAGDPHQQRRHQGRRAISGPTRRSPRSGPRRCPCSGGSSRGRSNGWRC